MSIPFPILRRVGRVGWRCNDQTPWALAKKEKRQRYGACMQVPLEIAFHNIESSDWAEQEIRTRVAELERIYDRLFVPGAR
jgi:hypothetical protein